MTLGLIYDLIIDKLYQRSNMEKRLEVRDARKIISSVFRVSRTLTSRILHELNKEGLIKYECIRKIEVVWKPRLLS